MVAANWYLAEKHTEITENMQIKLSFPALQHATLMYSSSAGLETVCAVHQKHCCSPEAYAGIHLTVHHQCKLH